MPFAIFRSCLLSFCLVLSVHAARPTIERQPTRYSTFTGETIRLRVTMANPFTSISWSRNGIIIPGQNLESLVIPNATPADSATYRARITNPEGTTLSNNIPVEVIGESSPLEPWQPVLPQTVPYQVNCFARIDGRYLAGTREGTVHLSTDGRKWSHATMEKDPDRIFLNPPTITRILAHRGTYYAFAIGPFQTSTVPLGGWTSTDLMHWEWNARLPQLWHAVSNGEQIVAVRGIENGGRVLSRSTDGVTWTDQPGLNWGSLTEFKGSFFLHNGRWQRSDDGASWEEVPTEGLPPSFQSIQNDVSFPEHEGNLVYFRDRKTWKSADGITWEPIPLQIPATGYHPLMYSTVLRSFSALGRMYLVDNFGDIHSSSDLSVWQTATDKQNYVTTSTTSFGSPELLLAALASSGIALTADPAVAPQPFPAVDRYSINGLVATREHVYATRTLSANVSSDGGTSWTDIGTRLNHVASGNGIHVGRGTYRYTSYDGKRWSQLSPQASGTNGVAFGNGRFVDLQTDFQSFKTTWSTDGIHWSDRTTVPIDVQHLRFTDGRFWALAGSWSISNTGSNIYQLAHSVDGENWTTRTISLPSRPGNWSVRGIERIGDRLVIATGDPSWWLVSDNNGSSWSKLDTGYGYLYASDQGLVRHGDWLLSLLETGDLIMTRDGLDFLRVDAVRGTAIGASQGALFLKHGTGSGTGISRSGAVSQPSLMTFGLNESESPARGSRTELGIVVTDFLPGDRIEIRLNGMLVHESDVFYTHYEWTVSPYDDETLVVTVIRADGSSTSRSWHVAADPPVVQSVTAAPAIENNGRLGYQMESGNRFYHLTPEGLLRHSADLLHWSAESLPGLTSVTSFEASRFQIVTRPDGARLLALTSATWSSAPGSSTWSAGRDFPQSGGTGAIHLAAGNRFMALHPVRRSVFVEQRFGTSYYAYVFDHNLFMSTDGLEWIDLGRTPTVGKFTSQASDGYQSLIVEEAGFDEVPHAYTTARLWKTGTDGSFVAMEPLPGMIPSLVARRGGQWIVQGEVDSVPRLVVSDDAIHWTEVPLPSPDRQLQSVDAFGDGKWIVRDNTGLFVTTDFQDWSRLSNIPSTPVWAAGTWVNRDPQGSGPVDHFQSEDLDKWTLVTATYPTNGATILAVTGGKLASTFGKGLFAMDENGNWETISSKRNINACVLRQTTWICSTSSGELGHIRDGVETWTNPLDAPPPTVSSPPESVSAFLESADGVFAMSNRALYFSGDGLNWQRRANPSGRTVTGFVRLGDRLIVETVGSDPSRQLFHSDNDGLDWTAVSLPAGTYNYSISSSTGLYVENGNAFYIAAYNQRYQSPDGALWNLLPSGTDAYLPRPILVPDGRIEWNNAAGSNRRQWQFIPPNGSAIPLTPPVLSNQPVPQHFASRLVALLPTGVEVTPLANLVPEFPTQPGHTLRAGDRFTVRFNVRNLGFDAAPASPGTEIKLSLLPEGDAAPTELELGGVPLEISLAADANILLEAEFALPRGIAGGRYHLVARLQQNSRFPIDGVPTDDRVISSEALVRVPEKPVRIRLSNGGQLFLNGPSGKQAIVSGSLLATADLPRLIALPDPGKAFAGWTEESGEPTTLLARFIANGPVDTDLDGVADVIERLLGSDPSIAGPGAWSLSASNQEAPSVTIREMTDVSSHRLSAWVSTDLTKWVEVPREHWSLVDESAGQAHWRIPLPRSVQGFVRFRAEAN